MTATICILMSWFLLGCNIGYSSLIYQQDDNFVVMPNQSEHGCEDVRSNFYKSILTCSIFMVASGVTCFLAYVCFDKMNGLRISSVVQLIMILSFFWAFEAGVGLSKCPLFFCIGNARCMLIAQSISVTFFTFLSGSLILNIYPLGMAFLSPFLEVVRKKLCKAGPTHIGIVCNSGYLPDSRR